MSVSTYLELYLTLYGWILYDGFWGIITDTGIAYMPFVGMFLRNIVEPIKSQEAKDASGTSLRRIEVDIVTMFTVIVLAVQPMITVSPSGLGYTKRDCTAASTEVNIGSTGTSYDTAFSSIGGVSPKIPVWWYGVLAITGGFNDAAILAIPCETDVRLLGVKLDNSRVKAPHLREQVRLFYKDCYHSAITEHLNKRMPSAYPEEDLQWLGSKTFLDDLYKKKHASTEIKGFTYSPIRDVGYYDPRIYPSSPPVPYGKPTCEEWWKGTGPGTVSGSGLRDQLKAQIDPTLPPEIASYLSETLEESENRTIKEMINREDDYFKGLKGLNDYNDSGGDGLNAGAALVGSIISSAVYYPAMYMVKASAPVIQATTLMMIYMLLPFFLLFSSYNIGKMIFMTIIIFSVKFWTVLWAVSHWLDNNLISALMPSFLDYYGADIIMRFVVGFVITALYVSMPLFWSGLLTWAGHKMGAEINNSTSEMRGGSKDAGSKGGDKLAKKGK